MVAFKMLDIDNSGTITKEELASVFARGDYSDAQFLEHWNKILTECDLNNDGVISLEEFTNAIEASIKDDQAG